MIYLPEVCRQPRTVDRIFERAGCGVGCWEIGFPSTWFHELRPTPSHVFKCPGEVNDKLRTDFTCIWELNWKIVCQCEEPKLQSQLLFHPCNGKRKRFNSAGLLFIYQMTPDLFGRNKEWHLALCFQWTNRFMKSFLCNSSNSGFYSFSLFQFPPKTSKTTIIYINFDLETYPTG